jgi:DNA repair photolyase
VKPRPISNPPNPFALGTVEYLEEVPLSRVEIFEDASKSIISSNDSPDIPFDYSVNAYRGCNHGCAYCYARPGHEYLDFGAGTDFDTKIVVKRRAPELLRAAFEKPSWKGALLAFSGVTDCYQPLEASLRLTRGCLEVCAEYRNPVSIITKSPIIERDLDLLARLRDEADVRVNVSVPIFDEAMARAIEPGVAAPKRRLLMIRRLAEAGIPVGIMVAPIIPAVSDEGLADVLEAARAAGALTAGYQLLRLPGSVKDVFVERIKSALPLRAEKILSRIREVRSGALNRSEFGERMTGTGEYADAIAQAFEVTRRRLGFGEHPPLRLDTFRRPTKVSAQLALFG